MFNEWLKHFVNSLKTVQKGHEHIIVGFDWLSLWVEKKPDVIDSSPLHMFVEVLQNFRNT